MARNLRVLLLIPHLGGGGAEKVTSLLAKGLSREKYDVHLGLVTQNHLDCGPLPQWITIHRLDARRVRGGGLRLLRLVRQLEPDAILSNMAHLNFLVLLLRPFFPAKTRVLVRQNATISSTLASEKLPWYVPWLYRLLYSHADRIICQSQAMADDFESELGFGKERIAILRNPVDCEEIRAACGGSDTRDAGLPEYWPGAGPNLLAIGRLAPEKGFPLLLEAFANVRQRYPRAALVVVGSGPEEATLKSQCRSLGLEEAVHFPGYVQNPYIFYAGASLFVLSSHHEGMPNALLEALAGGLPIVATPASGGIVDLLHSLDGAWLAREASAASLTAALHEALGALHPGQRFHRLRAGAGASGGGFSFETAIAGYEEMIDAVCAQPHGKHIALVIPTLDRIGGAERHVMVTAKVLRQRGWQVSVVALSGTGGAQSAALTAEGVEYLSLHMRRGLVDPLGWTRFIRWLHRARPEIVHAHLPHAAWLARWSRLWAPVPVQIDTLHSSSTGRGGRRFGYWFSRRLPDQVTAVSQSVADAHLGAGMVNRKTLTVMHNGVDVEEWRPDESVRSAVRRELRLRDEFLWFASGRLEPVKDYANLLHAMASLPRSALLVIAGGGSLLNELTHLSSGLGLGERVRFLDFVPDVQRWLQAADGFVLSSRWEGLPMALLEAAACALPAVATNVPGSREVILDGETGTLVPPMDAPALARAMHMTMQTSLERRREMGARARQRVVEHFSLAAALDRCEELYGDLLRKKSRKTTLRRGTPPGSPHASANGSKDAS
jgi:glycosyltransferase involved in cell wall biosynthesis